MSVSLPVSLCSLWVPAYRLHLCVPARVPVSRPCPRVPPLPLFPERFPVRFRFRAPSWRRPLRPAGSERCGAAPLPPPLPRSVRAGRAGRGAGAAGSLSPGCRAAPARGRGAAAAMAPVQLESAQLVPAGPASAPAPPAPGAVTAAASPGYRLSTLIEFLLHRTYAELTVLADL